MALGSWIAPNASCIGKVLVCTHSSVNKFIIVYFVVDLHTFELNLKFSHALLLLMNERFGTALS